MSILLLRYRFILDFYDNWHISSLSSTGMSPEVFDGFHTQIRFTSCLLSKFFGQSFIFVLQIINPPWVNLQELDDPGLWGWLMRLLIWYRKRKYKSGIQKMTDALLVNAETSRTDKTPKRPKQYSHTVDLRQRSSVLVILIMLKRI